MTEFEDVCITLKSRINTIMYDIKELKIAVEQDAPNGSSLSYERKTFDKGEMIANIMFVYRHLEDAKSRLDNTIDAYNTGGWN